MISIPGPSSPWSPLLGGLIVGLIAGYLVMVLFGWRGKHCDELASSVRRPPLPQRQSSRLRPSIRRAICRVRPRPGCSTRGDLCRRRHGHGGLHQRRCRGATTRRRSLAAGGSWLLQTASGSHAFSPPGLSSGPEVRGHSRFSFPLPTSVLLISARSACSERWDAEQICRVGSRYPIPGRAFRA